MGLTRTYADPGRTATVAQAISESFTKSEYDGSHNFSEAAATSLRTTQGEEWVVASNATTPRIVDPNNFVYACSYNNGGLGSQWQTISLGVPGYNGPDPSLVGQDNALYGLNLLLDTQNPQGFKFGFGIRLIYTAEPCPISGTISWTRADWLLDQTNQGLDYPHMIQGGGDGTLYLTWTRTDSAGQHINVAWIYPWDRLTLHGPFENHCSNVPVHPGSVNSVFAPDAQGHAALHLVYSSADFPPTIRHEIFDTTTTSFECKNNVVGSYTHAPRAPTSCSLCYIGGIDTYSDLANPCQRETITPSIDSDQTTGTLMVSYATPGSGSCTDTAETRWYRSTNHGGSWQFSVVTGCQISLQPTIRSEFSPNYLYSGNSFGHWHSLSLWAPQGVGQLLTPTEWSSTTDGTQFGGYSIGPAYPTPTIDTGSCYWGDYNSTALASSGVFHAFSQQISNVSTSTINTVVVSEY